MKPTLQKLATFTEGQRVRFLKRLARELRHPEIRQAVVICMRRDSSVCHVVLDDLRTTHETLGMLERAKLEMFEDLVQSRCRSEGGR